VVIVITFISSERLYIGSRFKTSRWEAFVLVIILCGLKHALIRPSRVFDAISAISCWLHCYVSFNGSQRFSWAKISTRKK
jgi:hypothetical protein